MGNKQVKQVYIPELHDPHEEYFKEKFITYSPKVIDKLQNGDIQGAIELHGDKFNNVALQHVLRCNNNNNALIIERKKKALKYLLCDQKKELPMNYLRKFTTNFTPNAEPIFLNYIIQIIPYDTFIKYNKDELYSSFECFDCRTENNKWINKGHSSLTTKCNCSIERDFINAVLKADRMDLTRFIKSFGKIDICKAKSKEMRFFLICNGVSTKQLNLEQLKEIYDTYGEIVDDRLRSYADEQKLSTRPNAPPIIYMEALEIEGEEGQGNPAPHI